jgi:hypothetical protein
MKRANQTGWLFHYGIFLHNCQASWIFTLSIVDRLNSARNGQSSIHRQRAGSGKAGQQSRRVLENCFGQENGR